MTIKLWIFDLDDTLHNASAAIFPHINRSMTAYLQQHLQLDEAAANTLRVDYWHRYGSTLTGLMRHHGTNPHHFLWHTHQFPNLANQVLRKPRLRHVLQQLAAKKMVFSNGPHAYAQAVLKLMKIDDLFEEVMTLEHVNFLAKPHYFGFLRLLKKHRVTPAQCVMVEDSLANLRTAKRLGMRTVWISSSTRQPAWVDIKIRDVTQLSRVLPRLNGRN
ncbi:MAG: pyrimidine 5'-nucleotidase [Gallionella sp.]